MSDAVRILHLAPRLSGRGGADQHLLAQLEALADLDEQALCVERVDPDIRPPCRLWTCAGLGASGLRPVRWDRARLEALVAEWRPAVIHLHNVVNPAVLEWAAERPAVLTVQDHRIFCPGRGKWTAAGAVCDRPLDEAHCAGCFTDPDYFAAIWRLTRRRLRAAARLRLCVLSDYMRRELEAAGVADQRPAVIPPLLRPSPAALPAAPPAECVLFAGRLVAAKGVGDAVAAWRSSGVELPLVLAGTGSLRAGLEAAGLDVRGWLDRTRLAALLRAARVVVMAPRWQEPFGIAGLEALAAARPVAAWRSGGIAEWHPGPGLVDWGDVAGLGRAIAALAAAERPAPLEIERAGLIARQRALYAALS